MLTIEKVEIFKKYKGYYDGYHIQNIEKSISDLEWSILDNFIQDIYLIRKKLVSKKYEEAVNNNLIKECDSKETINLIFEVESLLNS